MYSATKTSLLFIGALGLAGCDDTSDDNEFDTTFSSFAEIEAALEPDLSAIVQEDGTLIDNASQISDSEDFETITAGSVTYNGAVIAEESDDGGTLIGQIEIVANLSNSRVEGTAGNFFHSNDGEVSGTLEGNSEFTQDVGTDGDHFEMQLTGELEILDTDYDTTLDLQGNFLDVDESADQVAGDADFDFGDDGPEYEQGAFQGSR
ncbi:hypothetical protein BC777_0797 [Yoonia maricola]|uniref:Transferrin-binding protein B C-lobe/N-lobe beta barrel domain-containing protein n=1 Tax=Yoonia maricola TaxID=420999 RepID=A0A2M8WM59_9RHOB|nr:hypothetical protein [Yoonia maricola]PJI91956.1 hypothetical protein BC777_0797 [Yoonia maricola]